jgi:hypothetical protein
MRSVGAILLLVLVAGCATGAHLMTQALGDDQHANGQGSGKLIEGLPASLHFMVAE